MLVDVVINLAWIVLAYLIGSINFSIILTKFSKNKKNIKEVGSGNAGATNAMRSYGFRFGLLIFILDTSKSFWLGFVMGLLQSKTESFNSLIPQMVLLFVIIGHIFPIYFKFKGGKGAATLLGMIASISLFLAMIGTVLFLLIVGFTKYVSLGSVVVPYALGATAFALPYFNYVDTVIKYGPFWLSPVCIFIGSLIVALSHYKNIIALLNGNERKTDILSIFKNKNSNNETVVADEKSLPFQDATKEQHISNVSYINESYDSLIDRAIDKEDFSQMN